MEGRHCNFQWFTLLVLFLLTVASRLQSYGENRIISGSNHTGCAYLHCKNDGVCLHRKFRCRDPPCPSMLYCAKSRTESLKGPSTCDNVHCSQGYLCILRVRHCQWDEKCKQQIARCVSRKEYHEGPASCAGFKCSQGKHCVLRESFCLNPPCKLLKSCAKNKDIHMWFGKCRSLGCPSEFQCFLRRPANNCFKPPCKHTPDCVTTIEDDITNKHCQGWICPPLQKCWAEIAEPCESDHCNITRTCHDTRVMAVNESSLFLRRSLNHENGSITSFKIDIQQSSNTSNESMADHKTKTLHTWLNHLNSKTEMDAIRLWIKNAEKQKDFTQFQDWLRSVKDILGPAGYTAWVEKILSSTSHGEEFRKWLEASHVQRYPDADNEHETPIFLEHEKPKNEMSRTVTGDRYEVHNTLNTHSVEVLNEKIEEINTILKSRNLTNIIQKPISLQRMLPPHTDLDDTLLNHLKEPSHSPFFNYMLKYPIHRGSDISPSQLSNVKNSHGQPYYTFPKGIVEESGNFQLVNYDSGSGYKLQGLREMIPRNKNMYNDRKNSVSFNIPEPFNSISLNNVESLSLWTESNENTNEKLVTEKNQHTVTNFDSIPGDKTTMEEVQKFDVSPDLLENFIQLLQFSLISDMQNTAHQTSSMENSHDISHAGLQVRTPNREQDWKSATYISSHEVAVTTENPVKKTGKLLSDDDSDAKRIIVKHFQPHSSNFFVDKLVDTLNLNQQDEPRDTNSKSKFRDGYAEIGDTMNSNSFVGMNKNLLPYVQTFLQTMNQAYDDSNDKELSADESSMEKTISSLSRFSNIERKHIIDDNIFSQKTNTSGNFKAILHSPYVRKESCNDSVQNENQNLPPTTEGIQEEKDSRTLGPVDVEEEHIPSVFYDIPSYGANGDTGIAAENYIYEMDQSDSSKVK